LYGGDIIYGYQSNNPRLCWNTCCVKSRICGLGTTSGSTGCTPSTVLPTEIATGGALATRSIAFETAATSSSGQVSTSSSIVAATVSGCLRSTGFNNDVLSIYNMWIGGDSSLITCGGSKFHEGAVLQYVRERTTDWRSGGRGSTYLLAVDVKVGELAEAS
jgi:hypothetical protein